MIDLWVSSEGKQPLPWLPESLRLFILCEAMNWGNLPIHGGLYDQDPRLLEDWMVIFTARTKYEQAKAAKEAASRK